MRYPIWKPLLIVAVVLACAAVLWFNGLKPGIDLAGGVTLVYDVDVPEGVNAEDEIDSTISILSNRVDPAGVMNLGWRRMAGNRIEVQMAQATPAVRVMRERYEAALERLNRENVDPRGLEAALQQQGEARVAALDRLTGMRPQLEELRKLRAAGQTQEEAIAKLTGDDAAKRSRLTEAVKLRANLTKLVTLQDRLDAALAAEGEASRGYEQAVQADADEGQADAAAAAVDAAIARLVQAQQAREAAQARLDAGKRVVLADNLNVDLVINALQQPDIITGDDPLSPRDAALEGIKKEHPGHAASIDEVVRLYMAYEQVKGPLDDPQDLISLLRGSGVLEFRIAARPGVVPDEAEYRARLREAGPTAGRDLPWQWFEVADIRDFLNLKRDATITAETAPGMFASTMGMVGDTFAGEYYVLLATERLPNMAMTREQEWEVDRASVDRDDQGLPNVLFQTDARGAALMGPMTEAHKGEQMAIVLDDKVTGAPTIQSQLPGGGQITGSFTQQEARDLANVLKAGAIKGRLSDEPISVVYTSPSLGQDNLQRGLIACVAALIIVAVFMLGYYFLPGFVADIALLINVVLILGTMAMFNAVWTLPGIAGVVLTIGMAVDANVLIFERIREELERGADVPASIRLGFEKAFSTIVDANLTTFITCVVLFYTATADIKGFAITLMVGILATLFASLFGSRVVLELYAAYARPRSLRMLPTAVGAVRRFLSPDVNWLALRRFFFPLSAVLILGGLIAIGLRGRDMLGIEFRSGTQVTFELRPDLRAQKLSRKQVEARLDQYAAVGEAMQTGTPVSGFEGDRAAIARELTRVIADHRQREAADPDIAPLDLRLLSEATVKPQGDVEGTRADAFSIATLIEDQRAVSEVVEAAFADVADVKRPLRFAGAGEPIERAPVFAVRNPSLSAVLSEAGVDATLPPGRDDVSDQLGGVMVVVRGLSEPTTESDIEARIMRMRSQIEYQGLGVRTTPTVVGLGQPAGQAKVAGAGAVAEAGGRVVPTYRAFAVLTRDNTTNYVLADSAARVRQSGGLGESVWRVTQDALGRPTSLAAVSSFSSQVSSTMQQQAITAILLSLLAVVAYIWFRFGSIRYGLAAIGALVHDVTITLGILAVCGWLYESLGFGGFLLLDPLKVDLAIVAAVLTIIGYSLNDTIVVFDRIRENRGRLARATPAIMNHSINQTVSRTVLTSSTTLLAVLVLYLVGGEGVHGFAFTMLIGILVGTYSSIAIATPMLLIGYRGPGNQTTAPPARRTREQQTTLAPQPA